jgi:hypothetical protein
MRNAPTNSIAKYKRLLYDLRFLLNKSSQTSIQDLAAQKSLLNLLFLHEYQVSLYVDVELRATAMEYRIFFATEQFC